MVMSGAEMTEANATHPCLALVLDRSTGLSPHLYVSYCLAARGFLPPFRLMIVTEMTGSETQ